MRKILSLFICLCLLAVSTPSIVTADTAAKEISQTKDAEDKEKSDYGAVVTGNHQTVIRLLEQSKFQTQNGHGFAAERGNNLIDRWQGKNASVVGDDNVKNGADRKIINRDGTVTWIQDKYYSTGKQSIDACFENNSFRYFDGDGNPMQIEVPADQYDEAVAQLKDRIRKGHVKGVTNEAEAETLVRKGHLTFQQARNLAKAGTIESLKYDAKNGAVSAACGFGISAVMNYAVCRLNGDNRAEAIKTAAAEGIKTGAVVFATSVIAGQLVKTKAVKVFAPSAEALTKALGPKFSKALLNAVGKETAGTSVESSAAKILRNQGLTSAITVIVLNAGDIVELFQGRISARQLIKNLAVSTAGVAGGYAGSVIGGAAGSAVAPGVGTAVGSVTGAVIVGGAVGYAADKVAGVFIKDDAEEMLELIQEVFLQTADEYLLNEAEADCVVEELKDTLTGDNLKEMYKSNDKASYARTLIEPLISKQLNQRKKIDLPTEEELRAEMLASMEGVVFIH